MLIALIVVPSNLKRTLIMIRTSFINNKLIKGVLYSKEIEFLNPATIVFLDHWKVLDMNDSNILFDNLNFLRENEFDVLINSTLSQEQGLVNLESFMGSFNIKNCNFSDFINRAVRMTIFWIKKSNNVTLLNLKFSLHSILFCRF